MTRPRWRDWLSYEGIDEKTQHFFDYLQGPYNKNFEETKLWIDQNIQQLQLKNFFARSIPNQYVMAHELFVNLTALYSPEGNLFLQVMAYFFQQFPDYVLQKTFEYAAKAVMQEDAKAEDQRAFFLICCVMENLKLKNEYSKAEKEILQQVCYDYIKNTDDVPSLENFFEKINTSTFFNYHRHCLSQIFSTKYPLMKINLIEYLQAKIINLAKRHKGEITPVLLTTVFSPKHEQHGVSSRHRARVELLLALQAQGAQQGPSQHKGSSL